MPSLHAPMPSRRAALRWGLAVPAALALPGALAGCSSPSNVSSEVGFAEGDGSFSMIPVDKRRPAEVLTGKDLSGKALTTGGHTGTPVIVNVWGSWCGPCRKEAPELVKAVKQLGERAVMIGLNTRDQSPQAALAFCREFGITWPNFWDPDGELLLKMRDLPPKAIPSTIILDPQGRVAARVLGDTSASTLVGLVDDVAAGK